jgi:hypothetical protein
MTGASTTRPVGLRVGRGETLSRRVRLFDDTEESPENRTLKRLTSQIPTLSIGFTGLKPTPTIINDRLCVSGGAWFHF